MLDPRHLLWGQFSVCGFELQNRLVLEEQEAEPRRLNKVYETSTEWRRTEDGIQRAASLLHRE